MRVVEPPPSRLQCPCDKAILNYMETKSMSMSCQSSGFSNLDIGSPKLPGCAKLVEAGWDLIAGGADIWEQSDQFHFLCKQISGDFDVAVRVESFTPAHLYSKAGLMIRANLNADSAHVMFLVFAANSPRNNNLGAYRSEERRVGKECRS